MQQEQCIHPLSRASFLNERDPVITTACSCSTARIAVPLSVERSIGNSKFPSELRSVERETTKAPLERELSTAFGVQDYEKHRITYSSKETILNCTVFVR